MDSEYKICLASRRWITEITLVRSPLHVEVEGCWMKADITILSVCPSGLITKSHWKLAENWTAHSAYEALVKAAGTNRFLLVLNAVRCDCEVTK